MALAERLGERPHLVVDLDELGGLRLQQLGLAPLLAVQLEDDRPEVEQQRLADALLAIESSAQPGTLEGARPTIIRVSL